MVSEELPVGPAFTDEPSDAQPPKRAIETAAAQRAFLHDDPEAYMAGVRDALAAIRPPFPPPAR